MTHWLWLVILLILLAQPWRTMMVSGDGDACLHWRMGEWMLQHKQIIRSDIFSHTRLGQPIISKEWLSEIIFAGAGRLGGLYGLVVVAALVIATTFAFLHHRSLQETGNDAVAILVTFIAAWAACTHWLARPHVFSFLLAALWGDALRRFEHGEPARRLFITLAGLTVLWVNLHGGYLAGFITLGAYWLGALIEMILLRADATKRAAARRKLAVLTGGAMLCAGASLLNPNGYNLHVHNLQFLRSDYLTNWLAEYASPDFHAPDTRGFLAWLALMFLTLALARPRLSPASGLVLVTWTYFALYAVRNIPLLVVFTAPIIASALAEAPLSWVRRFSGRLRDMREISRGGPLVAAIAVIAAVVVPRPTEMPVKKWPVEALEFIKEHRSQFEGNMFNVYVWGGYLLHALPEHRVFVDGRTDFYGDELIRQYDDISMLHTNWQEGLQQYNVSWTLLPAEERLNVALALLPGWDRVYSNQVATIFCRTR